MTLVISGTLKELVGLTSAIRAAACAFFLSSTPHTQPGTSHSQESKTCRTHWTTLHGAFEGPARCFEPSHSSRKAFHHSGIYSKGLTDEPGRTALTWGRVEVLACRRSAWGPSTWSRLGELILALRELSSFFSRASQRLNSEYNPFLGKLR